MSNETKEVSQTEQSEPTEKPAKRRRPPIKRREILVLASIWLVGCTLVGGLIAIFYTYRPPADPVPSPGPQEIANIPFRGGTAKTAYLAALTPAQAWQGDVALVATSTTWSNATVEALGQVDTWDFSFFSDDHSRMYLTVVAADERPVGRAHPFKLRRAPKVIRPERWIVDSDEAISIWVNNGGGAFLRAFPENQVEALLRQSATLQRPVWNIIGTSADQSQIFFMTIDATNGTILNRN